jgi:hypothetical protein
MTSRATQTRQVGLPVHSTQLHLISSTTLVHDTPEAEYRISGHLYNAGSRIEAWVRMRTTGKREIAVHDSD